MPFIMSGSNATAIFNGDYIDNGSEGQANEAKYVDVTPPHASRRFTGQQKYLDRLEEFFASPRRAQQAEASVNNSVENEGRCVLLHGIGGVGKTQLALKFAERTSKRFWRTFWIDASSVETMQSSLKSIARDIEAKALGVESSASSVLRWLSREERDWLLIYDNADGRPEDLEAYIPQGSGGNILLTSRNPNMRQFVSHKEGLVPVVDMNEDDATSLLMKWVDPDGTAAGVKPLARSIAKMLYCLPLAVDQAGAAIHSGLCTIDKYPSIYSSRRKDLMSHPSFRGASNYGRAAYTTWDLSYSTIHAAALGQGNDSLMTSRAAESAILIIDIFAFLHNDSILEEIIKRAAESPEQLPWASDESLTGSGDRSSANDLEFLHRLTRRFLVLDSSGSWDPFPFREGIQVLVSFSLISTDMSRRSYSMHPLVHSWSRDRMNDEDRKVGCSSASALLAHSITRKFMSSDYTFRRHLIPHIKSCNLYTTQVFKSDVYAEQEHINFRLAYHENGFFKEAETLDVCVTEMRRKALGREHPDTLTSMANLAMTYKSQGRYDEAEKLQVEVLGLRRQVLGTGHKDTLTSMANLALTYWSQGRHGEAEKLRLETLERQTKVLGREYPDTLDSMCDLALIYGRQGKYNEAETLQLETLELSKKVLGSEHPNTLMNMNNLASTYWRQGRYKEADKLGSETLGLKKKVLGREHPGTLSSMNNLASIYSSQGRYKEAEKLELETLELKKKVFGREHPSTLKSMANLAGTWIYLGYDTDAIELMREAAELSVKVLGSDHPDTIYNKRCLEEWGDSERQR